MFNTYFQLAFQTQFYKITNSQAVIVIFFTLLFFYLVILLFHIAILILHLSSIREVEYFSKSFLVFCISSFVNCL